MKLCELCSEKKDFPTNKTFPFPALYPLPICSLSAPYLLPTKSLCIDREKT